MSSLILVYVAGFGSLCYALQEVLATNSACAYSTTHTATVFNAPQDGTISGIKAVYVSGSPMTCDYFCSTARSKWGCPHCGGERKFMVEMMKVTNAGDHAGYTIYPVASTTVIQYLYTQLSFK